MAIPLVDLQAQHRNISDDVNAVVADIMQRAQFILGPEEELFEEEFAAYCGAKHCIGVASGTEALHLALRAVGVGLGDEVITVANTFVATGYAIAYTGATPVFVDVDPTDYNIDVNLLEAAITPRTKAIAPVHLYGQPARMAEITELAAKHGLRVIQDACQAHGATYRDERLGALGDAACYSFYPSKNLGAYGDGGAIVTNDDELDQQLRLLRNYGQRAKNDYVRLGYNSRLDTLQAAILLVKLRRLDEGNERRREIARLYGELLADGPVQLPVERDDARHVYHLYIVQHAERDRLAQHLNEQGVGNGIHYPTPLPHIPLFHGTRQVPDGVPVAAGLCERILSLPMYPELTDDQVRQVAEAVASFATVPAVS
ncbi:MAG: DegT/DnrJ/EryC1/StrS family aminotransferase [Planctomycetales bacterium]|nr:DegT/DnrJ/EryC1/StrS family aminotransferase [Planctomycetales bacterium]